MSILPGLRSIKLRSALTAFVAGIVATTTFGVSPAVADPSAVTLPPAGAQWDYQIGRPNGAYTPSSDVQIVSRDRQSAPAPGLYNICYVNAYQAQPNETWDSSLLLHDANGNVVVDTQWNEPLLDITTAAKRTAIMDVVGPWIDGCASSGFDAVEPDNYDSYERSQGLITTSNAEAFMSLLVARAHSHNLAIAQKNTLALAPDRQALGLDFAVVEECGAYTECADYVGYFGNNIVDVEYTDTGMANVCDSYAGTLSIVRRDVLVTAPGSDTYVYGTCS
ncbi:endo alpha-1,4 polygalactosaminidase [Streptomyces anandii]|uniref:endo alpha-1,4 polygalactosaminidase n=1 Tax=Streptomyces anandii TaxID=285454 RepID=UPI0036F4C5E8